MTDSMPVSMTVVYNHAPKLRDELPMRVLLAMDRGAAIVEAESKAAAPFVSGALRASGFRISAVFNDYSTAIGAMRSINGNLQPTEPPHVEPSTVSIGFAAPYAVFIHDGTHAIAGRPFLLETLERHQNDMSDLVMEAINKGAEGGPMPEPVGSGG